MTFSPQTTVYARGDPADYMYIILKGRVTSRRELKDGVAFHVATPTDGEAYGELSLFDLKKDAIKARLRTTDTTAVEETACLRVHVDVAL